MKYHFLAECLSTPWAMQPERMAAYASFLASRYFGPAHAGDHRDDTRYDENGAALKPQAAVKRAGARSGAIAVVPILGTIMQRSSQINICEGGTSTQAISAALRDANADDTVSDIILDIDSPGGSVYGVAELAAEIRASKKPVTAVAKWKTTVQLVALGFLIAGPAGEALVPGATAVGVVLLWIAAILTLYTGWDYMKASYDHIGS